MAIRSLDKGVRMPTAPEFFQPNFDVINQSLASNQSSLDQYRDLTDQVKIQAMEVDAARRDQLMNELHQGIDQNAEVFSRDGTAQGQRDLRKRTRQLKRTMLPGGEGYEINENFKRYNQYAGEVQKALAKGTITEQDATAALDYAKTNFGGTTLDPASQSYSRFSGDRLAQSFNEDDLLNEALEGFKKDIIGSGGTSFTKHPGYIVTWKSKDGGVKTADIRDYATNYLEGHEGLTAYSQQRQKFGLDDSTTLGVKREAAIRNAANKFGFRDRSYEETIKASEALKQANRVKLKKVDYDIERRKELSTRVLNLGPSVNTPGANKINIAASTNLIANQTGHANPAASATKRTTPAIKLNDALADPTGKLLKSYVEAQDKAYGNGMGMAIVDAHNDLENHGFFDGISEQAQNEKIARYIKSETEERYKHAFAGEPLLKKEQDEVTTSMFGREDSNAPGTLGLNQTIQLYGDGGRKIFEGTYEQLEEKAGGREDLVKGVNVTQLADPNLIHPSMATGTAVLDGDHYQMVILNTDNNESNRNRGVHKLSKGLYEDVSEPIFAEVGEITFGTYNVKVPTPDGSVRIVPMIAEPLSKGEEFIPQTPEDVEFVKIFGEEFRPSSEERLSKWNKATN